MHEKAKKSLGSLIPIPIPRRHKDASKLPSLVKLKASPRKPQTSSRRTSVDMSDPPASDSFTRTVAMYETSNQDRKLHWPNSARGLMSPRDDRPSSSGNSSPTTYPSSGSTASSAGRLVVVMPTLGDKVLKPFPRSPMLETQRAIISQRGSSRRKQRKSLFVPRILS